MKVCSVFDWKMTRWCCNFGALSVSYTTYSIIHYIQYHILHTVSYTTYRPPTTTSRHSSDVRRNYFFSWRGVSLRAGLYGIPLPDQSDAAKRLLVVHRLVYLCHSVIWSVVLRPSGFPRYFLPLSDLALRTLSDLIRLTPSLGLLPRWARCVL